jgi:hypothetical protein
MVDMRAVLERRSERRRRKAIQRDLWSALSDERKDEIREVMRTKAMAQASMALAVLALALSILAP